MTTPQAGGLEPLPLESRRDDFCAASLGSFLRRQPGLKAVFFQPAAGELRLRYDPRQLSRKRIAAIGRKLSAALAAAEARCPFRLGGGTCEECPAAFEASAGEPPPFQWTFDGRGGWGVGVDGSGDGAATFEPLCELSTRVKGSTPLAPRRFRRALVLDALPVALCGLLLAAGWLAGLAGLAASTWLFMGACVAGGLPTLWSTLRSLRAFRLDVNLLMIAGAGGAALLGYWDEGATLLFLFTLAGALESFAMGRTRRAVEGLIALRPDEATVMRAGRFRRVPIEEVEVGEEIAVRPGERIPLDGEVFQGEGYVDESALTGEALARSKEPGSKVLAGSINLDGSLLIAVKRRARESTLARIVALVEEARGSRAPTQRLFERFARVYIPLVIAAAAGTALLPPLLGYHGWSEMFYRAMTLLVVASPCALVIAAPATVLSAIGAAARRGILFKGGAAVELLGQARVVAFDKTGTLTDGALVVAGVEAVGGSSEDDVIALAAAVEEPSEHLLARAVVEEARRRGMALPQASAFRATPGLGVEATIGGELILAGNRRFLEKRGVPLSERVCGGTGKTIYVARSGRLAGCIRLGDRMRKEVPALVKRLQELGIRRIAILTRDEAENAREVAAAAGIEDVRAGLLPEEKVAEMKKLAAGGELTVMVGDGVNDAPAMAAASVGVAMGAAGTDAALEASGVVLMASDLDKLSEAIEIGRRARRVLYQSLLFAAGVIVSLVGLALAGALPLPAGVIGHEGSTLIVVLNGLRLLVHRRRL
jgi:Cd2+/Zn2+-exporting ATPase